MREMMAMRITPTTSGHFPLERVSMTCPPTIELTIDLALAVSYRWGVPSHAGDYIGGSEDNSKIPSETETGNRHGTKAHLWTECCHISRRNHSNEIEEENGQE